MMKNKISLILNFSLFFQKCTLFCFDEKLSLFCSSVICPPLSIILSPCLLFLKICHFIFWGNVMPVSTKRKIPETFTQPFNLLSAFEDLLGWNIWPKHLTYVGAQMHFPSIYTIKFYQISNFGAKSKSPNKFSNFFSHDDVLTNIGLAS